MRTKIFCGATVFLALLFLPPDYAKGGIAMGFKLRSPEIAEGSDIPRQYTCDGLNISPEVIWDGAPAGTKSFVLIVEDPDAPGGVFTHWVVYDLPAATNKLKGEFGNRSEAVDNIKQGMTDFGFAGYGGPCPPREHGKHRYYFILRAIDVETLGLNPGVKKRAVERAMAGHIIEEAKFMGAYERK